MFSRPLVLRFGSISFDVCILVVRFYMLVATFFTTLRVRAFFNSYYLHRRLLSREHDRKQGGNEFLKFFNTQWYLLDF